MSRLIKILIVMSVSGAIAWAQTAQQNPQALPPPNAPAPGASAAVRPDPAKQMQLDLDQMESLVNNMAAQVSFIRDTNMSILLNTNVRLWTVLIRDLRMREQEQQRGMRPAASPPQR